VVCNGEHAPLVLAQGNSAGPPGCPSAPSAPPVPHRTRSAWHARLIAPCVQQRQSLAVWAIESDVAALAAPLLSGAAAAAAAADAAAVPTAAGGADAVALRGSGFGVRVHGQLPTTTASSTTLPSLLHA